MSTARARNLSSKRGEDKIRVMKLYQRPSTTKGVMTIAALLVKSEPTATY
ncbi:Uncharacterised protein [Vibrio cholerae]|nr:Uncharacterised protein [Vibrio cholerae]CSB33705.1 Uncharacterised protein [Vibrio cholerae]CSB41037.1 Uncharacterised protein [Vibrio cholerae]CSB80626.1 Uncharacterised protein [Vibrio cholerae]CSB99024.1 Uncharacterised protein [Vibrio cholerae]